jgi:excisionase family DNA binding protein
MTEYDDRPIDKLLPRPDEVATLLDVPLRTIYRWRSQHDGPRGYRIGRHVRYRVDDIECWLEDHGLRRSRTDEPRRSAR